VAAVPLAGTILAASLPAEAGVEWHVRELLPATPIKGLTVTSSAHLMMP
jgi:hypothetical protein